jgi:hypothetical protein
MTWSYTGPSHSDNDEVRFLIGDTDTTDQQITDEEITYLVTREGSVFGAAVEACKSIAAKYARLVDKSVDGLSISFSQLQAHYSALSKTLSSKSSAKNATPYAGGISVTDRNTDEADSDRVKPVFVRGDFDFPGNEPGIVADIPES